MADGDSIVKHLKCTELHEGASVTQFSPSDKTSVDLTWKAPSDVPQEGITVKFHYTIVQTMKVFWVDHQSAVITVKQ